MFVEFTSRSAECFLLRFCDTNSTIACTEEPDCRMAVSGPATPSVIDACCDGVEDVSCDPKYEVGHEFDVFGEQACQQMCREERQCAYWTLYGDVCFFYSACGTPQVRSKLKLFDTKTHPFTCQACSSCTSGAAFPDMSTCESHQVKRSIFQSHKGPRSCFEPHLSFLKPE